MCTHLAQWTGPWTGNQETWEQFLALPLIHCVTREKASPLCYVYLDCGVGTPVCMYNAQRKGAPASVRALMHYCHIVTLCIIVTHTQYVERSEWLGDGGILPLLHFYARSLRSWSRARRHEFHCGKSGCGHG